MSSITDTLKKNNFRFNKQFGQNFITDQNLLRAIVDDAKITKEQAIEFVKSYNEYREKYALKNTP